MNIILILIEITIRMIIPIRCFTCGEILADKWNLFIIESNALKNNDKSDNNLDLNLEMIDLNNRGKKTVEGKVLDKLNLHKYCCRRMMLGNVHIISYLS